MSDDKGMKVLYIAERNYTLLCIMMDFFSPQEKSLKN